MGKHRVLVVGGREENIPMWAHEAFDIELIDGTNGGRGRLKPEHAAEVVVIAFDYVSHNYSEQAQKIANGWGVPWFGVRGGWASAVERAARAGLNWFVNGLQKDAESKPEGDPEREEALRVVDNAWRFTVEHERVRANAAEKRLGKETRRRQQLEETVTRQRAAAERIVAELQNRHAKVREEEHDALRAFLDDIDEATAQARKAAEQLEGYAEQIRRFLNGGD